MNVNGSTIPFPNAFRRPPAWSVYTDRGSCGSRLRSHPITRETVARVDWLLDPDVTYLNRGGYRACPRPVFDRYLAWQRELEREPTDLFHRRLPRLLAEVRQRLAGFLGARAEDVALARNAT